MELSSNLLRTFLAVADEGGFTRAKWAIHNHRASVCVRPWPAAKVS